MLSVRRTPGAGARSERLDVAWWCRELRTLLFAGMTVVEALDTMQMKATGAARADVQAGVLRQLRQGHTLSGAMAADPRFAPELVASVRASERTSALIEALDDYLRYHEVLERLRKQVASAALYPAMVVTLGAVITVFLLLFVMPRFALLYRDMPTGQGTATTVLLALSKLASDHLWVLASLLAASAAGLAWAWRSGRLRRVASALVEVVRPLRERLDHLKLARLYHCLSLMFKGGYTLSEALSQCATLQLGPRYTSAIEAACRRLERGESVSAAMRAAGLADVVDLRLLEVGERSGNFERVLQTLAERHADNFTTFIARLTRVVEPALMLVVALIVGAIVVLMYMPVFDIASSVRG